MNVSESHDSYMRHALALARLGLGRTWPNPTVGCVLVKNSNIIAAARTADSGRPHAETRTLSNVGGDAKGATAYVTLEPCAHTGKTPPCAQALIDAGISRVVVACADPDNRVSGKGLAMLEAAGIEVVLGVLEQEALKLNEGFFKRISDNRPFVTLKTATTLDGFVATQSGESQWITSEGSRCYAHLERSFHDAVLAGIGTVNADNPMLNARVQGVDHPTVRIIMDRHLRIDKGSNLVRTARDFPLWIYHEPLDNKDNLQDLKKSGAHLFELHEVNAESVLVSLAEQGITRLLVEGGPTIAGHFMKAGYVDRVLWFRAPKLLGEGQAALPGLDIKALQDHVLLKMTANRTLGADILTIYEVMQCSPD